MAYIKADNPTTQEHYDFLEKLRQSGKTNIFGAAPYLCRKFGMDDKEAGEVLIAWMKAHGRSRV
jgi:hypothetical protein